MQRVEKIIKTMLNKHLLRYRIKNRKVIPSFIDTSSNELFELAAQLLEQYNPEETPTRSYIDESLNSVLNSGRDIKLSKGLNKILQDGSEFSSPPNDNMINDRETLFQLSSKLLKNKENTNSYELYRNKVISECNSFSDPKTIYSDLPENDVLEKIKFNKNPLSLLYRYNCTLAQSLLLYSQQIQLNIDNPEAREMRGFFRYLKFFRLMASISSKGRDSFKIEIDGPLSILENSQKYGLQLASFFPVVCFLKKWRLVAEIKLKNKLYKLSLSNEDNIKSHYTKPSSYIPEEFTMFEKFFNEKSDNWKIVESKDFINQGKQNMIFPDFTFKNIDNNKIIHLELFHRWHYTQLCNRITYLKSIDSDLPFFIGIDRSVYKKADIKKQIESNPKIAKKIFLFSDFPGVGNTLKALNLLILKPMQKKKRN
jgi:uncharacterized protein